jgi:hypothetical protein
MEFIKAEILSHLRHLSRVNLDFLEFIGKNPEALKRSSYTDLLQFKTGVSTLQPWPTFISRQVKNQLIEASTGMFHLVKQIPRLLFDNNPKTLAAYFDFSEDYTLLQMESIKGGHLDNLLARGDFIISPTGLKCIEYNVTGALGGFDLPFMESTYLNNPMIAKFMRQYQVITSNRNLYVIFCRHLLNAARKKFPPENHRRINIAIIFPGYVSTPEADGQKEYLNRVYGQVQKEQDDSLNGKVIICDFPDLTVQDYRIFCQGEPIHSLVEFYHGEVPRNIILTALMGNVLLYNGPITWLLSSKLNQALLSENENTGKFTPRERELINTYIPWTRRLVPGKVTYGTRTFYLEDFIYSHREKLVIKPARDLGGKDVLVGKYTSVDQWEKTANQALGDKTGNWILQEYVQPLPHMYQYGDEGYAEHQTTWGLFVFGSEYGGGFLRTLPTENTSGVINTHQGATKTAIFEVED